MRIVLTGATGFLGSALARHWALAGHELLLLGRPSSSTGRLEGVLARSPLHRIGGTHELQSAIHNFQPDAVVHTACSYGRHGEGVVQLLDANVRYGLALLEAATQGLGRKVSMIHTGTVLDPGVSLYALSKQQFSQWGVQLAALYPERVQFIDLRVQQMYGPNDDDSKFTTHVLRACRTHLTRLALTPGEQRRDFVHIDDVVGAIDTVLAHRSALHGAESIDVGSGQAVRMRDFVELVHRLTGSHTELAFGAVPYRANEAMHCEANITRLNSLGWRPQFDLESGLRQTLQQETAK